MSDIKPWQIIVIVVSIVVLAFSGWRMIGAKRIDSPTGHMTVDVISGQLYLVQKGKAKGIVYPAKNPETGERTLIPVQKNESDNWILDNRFEDSISAQIRKRSTALGSGMTIDILDNDPVVHVLMK